MKNTTQLIQDYFETKGDLSPRTLDQYTRALAHLSNECPDIPESPGPLRRALNKLTTPWTRDACWRVWRVFFKWAVREYHIANPMDSVDRPRLPVIEIRALEPGELAIVLASARSLRDQAVLVLALDSGIRASEFGKLRVGDIGTESIWAWGKGNKRVRVPISPETHQLLQSLIKSLRRNSPQSLLFTDRHGRTISRFTVYRIVRQCMDHAGITGPKRGPHCLRHSLGKNYIEDGGDPFTLKRIMRHNSIATTQKYVNLAMRSVIDQHTIHSPVRHALQGAQGILISREVDEILEKR